jgi:hypothetical protein
MHLGFEQGHAVRQFAHLASKARCPYSPAAGCISRVAAAAHVGATPDREAAPRDEHALACDSFRLRR